MAAARLLFEEQDPRAGAKKSLAEIVRRSIFGFDSDPMAAAIARFNLAKLSGCHPDEVNVHAVDFLDRDDLGLSAGTAGPQPFDLITGNPPWGSAIAREKKRYYHNNYFSAHSGINTFTLFMERAFDVIAPGGLVSFLIPEAYLNIKAHCNSRLHLLDSARVCNIALWGEQFRGVFAPSVSIIARQESSAEKRYSSIVEIHRAKSGPDIAAMVPQNSFHRHPEFIFNVNYSRKAAGIIDSIENRDCFYLKGRAKFFLGIVTGNNALHISTTRTDDHPDAIITGRDVNQYTLSFSGHYFNYNRESLQQVAPRALYTTPNKVLYRFIGRRLTFALDREGLYSLNNVNGFIPQFDCINIESILSVLNSSVLQYYYEKNFFTVKVLRGNLEKLPIRMIGRENQKKLARLAGQILQSEEGRCALERENIEDIIFHEYGIRDRQAHHITEYLAQPPSDI
jgi:predicted RNA methylase